MSRLKSYIPTIFLSVIAIIALAIALVSSIDNSTTTETGILTIQLVDIDGTQLDERQIMFGEGEELIRILERSCELNYEYYATMGVFLKRVGYLDIGSSGNLYIGIYIDDVYSNKGISSIKVTDGMTITFKLTDWTLE